MGYWPTISESVKMPEPEIKQEFTFGDYTITESSIDNENYWVRHKSGEGSEFSKKDINGLIHDYYDKNF